MTVKYDFSGWATRNDLLCSDGRTIRHGAFREQDGMTVPLVWQHQHSDPNNVLGKVLLENRPEGVYAYGSFNDSENAAVAKSAVQHGDITSLSIFANKLKQRGGDVLHGEIKEVSLVLSGANPGAFIETLDISHSEDGDESAIIYSGTTNLENGGWIEEDLRHADDESDEKISTKTNVKEENKMPNTKNDSKRSVRDVINEMTEEQKNVMYFLISEALKNAGGDKGNSAAHSDINEEEYDMKRNVFDTTETRFENDTLTHSDMAIVMKGMQRAGSLKASFEEHAAEIALAHGDGDQTGAGYDYGIKDIDYLFPDARALTSQPEFIKRETEWVADFLDSAKHSPFSRIKSLFADIREDEARAKGYIKGNLKKDEVFTLLKRTTSPTTIYKKQKLDRDDILDITDFDILVYLKGEMRIMLDEEVARAGLIGDGRSTSDDDKINETCVRPIYTDAPLYTVPERFSVKATATEDEKAKALINTVTRARKDYKGTGSPRMYTTEDNLTDMLMLEDKIGHRLYKTEAELCAALRVSKIVTVEVMTGVNRDVSGTTYELDAIIVNPKDYTFGADKGGQVSMFDDFDIDYNQQKYLLETRVSGALTKPFSALVIEHNVTSD